jgi:hypothetical protein
MFFKLWLLCGGMKDVKNLNAIKVITSQKSEYNQDQEDLIRRMNNLNNKLILSESLYLFNRKFGLTSLIESNLDENLLNI